MNINVLIKSSRENISIISKCEHAICNNDCLDIQESYTIEFYFG
jgi:hypothetical protein